MTIQYYEEPQGKKIKNFVFKWDDISSEEIIKHLITKNVLTDKSHFIQSLKSQINNEPLVLFTINKIYKSGSAIYTELSLFLPQNGYDGIKFDEDWILNWNESIAYKNKNNIKFEDWIKGFESRYPNDLLYKMKQAWEY